MITRSCLQFLLFVLSAAVMVTGIAGAINSAKPGVPLSKEAAERLRGGGPFQICDGGGHCNDLEPWCTGSGSTCTKCTYNYEDFTCVWFFQNSCAISANNNCGVLWNGTCTGTGDAASTCGAPYTPVMNPTPPGGQAVCSIASVGNCTTTFW
jgi:hypothetical protein